MSNEHRKNQHHFFKTGGLGCSYSLLDNNGVTYFYAVVSPDANGDSRTQALSAIERLDSLLKKERLEGGVVSQSVFLRDIGDKQMVRQLLIDYFGDNLPVITYIPQTPCEEGVRFLFEVVALKGETQRLRILRQGEYAVTVDSCDVSRGYFGGIVPDEGPVGAYARSKNALARMRALMESAGYSMSNLLRTWIYQGQIVQPEGKTQRYKELNRARTDFFRGVRFLENYVPETFRGAVYPASTGIGADDVDVTMAALAILSDREDVVCVPLENPGQTPAFDYAEKYSPQSPKFSRAMATVYDGCCTVYVSGTASIVDSETKHLDDAAAQARQTLENIRLLIDGDNLRRHGIDGFESRLENLALVRVYIKRPDDYETVRAICEERLGGTPIIFTFSDVCRGELLVEIEGVASCARAKKD